MQMKEINMATGRIRMTTKALGQWSKKMKQTTLTATKSLMISSFRVRIELKIKSVRSYVVMIFTPAGRLGWISFFIRSFTREITLSTFSPKRMTTMPPATSPLPSRSATPLRISGPSWIPAMVFKRTGVPLPSVPTGMFSRSFRLFIYPRPLTVYSNPEKSITRPSMSRLLRRTASMTRERGRL